MFIVLRHIEGKGYYYKSRGDDYILTANRDDADRFDERLAAHRAAGACAGIVIAYHSLYMQRSLFDWF